MNKLILTLITLFIHISIFAQDALTADVSYPLMINNCMGGSIDLQINDGIAPYDVVWVDSNRVIIQESYGISGNDGQEDLPNLGEGYYQALLTDSHCGTASIDFNLTCGCPDGCFGVRMKTNLSGCVNSGNNHTNNCDASIILHFPSSQFDVESYAWTGPNGFTSSTRDLFGLCDPGLYSITITYNRGLTYTIDNINICCCGTEGDSENFTCFLEDNGELNTNAEVFPYNSPSLGSIKLNTTGGLAVSDPFLNNYSHNWTGPNGFTGASDLITGLLPGTYTVVISDGCSTITESFEIIDCEGQIDVEANVLDVCGWWQQGSIELYSPSNNISNYSFKWSNETTSNKIKNLLTGNYCVTITDNTTNCERVDCYDITYKSTEPFDVNAEIRNLIDGQGAIILTPDGEDTNLTYEWSNGVNHHSIYNLTAGEYSVFITNASGCKIEKSYFINSFDCDYTIDRPLADYWQTSLNYEHCVGSSNLIIKNLQFGIPPYNITLNGIAASNGTPYTTTYVVNTAITTADTLPQEFPRGRYEIITTDACGRQQFTTLSTCYDCSYEYIPEAEELRLFGSGNTQVSDWRAFRFDFVCPCDANGCRIIGITTPRIKLKTINRLLDTNFEFIVTWPRGGTTRVFHNGRWRKNHIGDDVISPGIYVLNDAERNGDTTMMINVKRYRKGIDGGDIFLDCELDIPIQWGEANSDLIVFHDAGFGAGPQDVLRLSNGGTISDYYFANYKCSYCNPTTPSTIYTTTDDLCNGNIADSVQLFKYIPNNASDPCSGGGVLLQTYFSSDTNTVLLVDTTIIDSGLTNTRIFNNWVGDLRPSYFCSIGGGCIFDEADIFPGANLDKDVLLQFCNNSEELVDSDGDDIPDVHDPCPYDDDPTCGQNNSGGNSGGSGGSPDPDCDDFENHTELDSCTYWEVCDGDTLTAVGIAYSDHFCGEHLGLNCYYSFDATYCEIQLPDGRIYHEITSTSDNYVYSLVDETDCTGDSFSCQYHFYCGNGDVYLGSVCDPDCGDSTQVYNLCTTDQLGDVLSRSAENNNQSVLPIEVIKDIIRDTRMRELRVISESKTNLKAYPNPFENNINVEFYSNRNEMYLFKIIDTNGKIVFQNSVNCVIGINKHQLLLTGLNDGVYFLDVLDAKTNKIGSSKIIKL